MAQRNGPTVPKFGSFQPRANSKSSTTNPGHEHPTHRDRNRREDGRNHHNRKDNLSLVEDQRAESYKSPHERDRNHRQPVTDFEESESFIIDVHGDPKNLEYGYPHRYSVPIYYRGGSGFVIGAAPNVRIDRNASTEKGIVLRAFDRRDIHLGNPSSEKAGVAYKETWNVAPPATREAETERDFVTLKRQRSSDHDNTDEALAEPRLGIWSFITAHEGSGDTRHDYDNV